MEKKVGLNITEVLAIVFIVLKLCGVITWSWVWVLSPLWIGIALGVVLGIPYAILSRKLKEQDEKD